MKPSYTIWALVMWTACVTMTGAISLHRMNVDKNRITVSGSLNGGSMAQQLFVSYSSLFHGMATISHAFYRCGPGDGNATHYDLACGLSPTTNYDYGGSQQLYSPAKAILDIHSYFGLGLIDDPKYMLNKPFYIFAGYMSSRLPLQMGLGAVQVFEPFIYNRDVIQVRVQSANMTLPSDRRGLPDCSGPQNELWIGSCGFSAALESLQWIIGKKYVRAPTAYVKLQPLLEFDQTEFLYGLLENVVDGPAMDSVGYVYIPKACKRYGHKCLLHVYFHGCATGREFVGARHILNSGYLEVAETNGIIMLFPQAYSNPRSPMGCWDTFGFASGEFYATQIGAQVIVVKNMLDRILGPPEEYVSPDETSTTTTTTQKPMTNNYPYQVSSELLRSYDDNEASSQSQPPVPPASKYEVDGRRCTVTRISPDTVLKRCRPIE